jgi:hypothetical protein
MDAVNCFDDIRTQLVCMADMTLEEAPSVLGRKGEVRVICVEIGIML